MKTHEAATEETPIGVIQNISLADRVIRFALCLGLLIWPTIDTAVLAHMLTPWHFISWFLSAYIGLTGLLGWDPIYRLFGIRTCGKSERNRCGTIPFQVDAALGRNPVPKRDFDHSLYGSRHPGKQP